MPTLCVENDDMNRDNELSHGRENWLGVVLRMRVEMQVPLEREGFAACPVQVRGAN